MYLYYRSTPVECLHTILLGPIKYLFGELMERLTPDQKMKVAARINSFPTSGFTIHLSGSMTKHHKSAHGRDFKPLAQMALFVIWDQLDDQEQPVWLSLCKVKSDHYTHVLSVAGTEVFIINHNFCTTQ